MAREEQDIDKKLPDTDNANLACISRVVFMSQLCGRNESKTLPL